MIRASSRPIGYGKYFQKPPLTTIMHGRVCWEAWTPFQDKWLLSQSTVWGLEVQMSRNNSGLPQVVFHVVKAALGCELLP